MKKSPMMRNVQSLRLLGMVLLLCAVNGSFAQLSKKQYKQIRKEAKELARDGWRPSPGSLSIEQQLEKKYLMSMASDEGMVPKYMIGEGRSTDTEYTTAKMQSEDFAKQELAGQIKTEVHAVIKQYTSDKQINSKEAETVSINEMEITNCVMQKLRPTIPVMELYRPAAKGKTEVLLHLAYKREVVKEDISQLLK